MTCNRTSKFCIFFFGFFLSPCSTSYAKSVYLKLEAPIIKADLGKDIKPKNGALAEIINAGSLPGFSVGAGYDVSEYFETEVMYGLQNYGLQSYSADGSLGIPAGTYTVARRAIYTGKGKNRYVRREAACSDEESGFTDIRGNEFSTISGLSVSGSLHTILASIRLKPIKQISIFIPYFSLGAGVAHSNSRYVYSSYTSNSQTQVYKGSKSTTGLALEAGVGTQLRLAKNISLDFAAKYFDYGKHAMAPNISRKINGYKVTAGAMVTFPIKDRAAAVRGAQYSSSYVNRTDGSPRPFSNTPAYNETTESFIRKQGIAEGERNATLTIAKRMIKLGMDEANVAAVTGLSIDDLDSIIDEVRH